jgi:small-conductance mechanosensitive channel
LIAVAVSAGLGVFLALVLRTVIRRLQRQALKTTRHIDDLLVTLARIVVPSYVLLAGLWSAVAILPLKPAWHTDIGLGMKALMVLIITIGIARVAGEMVQNRALSHSGTSGSATIFVNITRVIIFALGLLLLLNTLGVQITPLLTALGVGGLAVALALQDTLQNLFAGIHILASHQIKPGAYILLDNGMEGYVEDTNWRNTVIRQTTNNYVVVPNDTLAKSILTNYHQPDQQMSVSVPVRVSYSSDLDHVEQVAIEVGHDVMQTVDGGVPEHEPTVRYDAFGDSGITFTVGLRTSEATLKGTVIHEFIKRAHRRFQAEGIDMPFPTVTLTHASGADGRNADGRDLVSAGARERGFD